MELYGGNLHILCTLTGGFILHRNDFWPNLVKIVFLSLFCLLYLLLLICHFKTFGIIIISFLLSLIVLSIQLVVVFLNKLLDKSIDLPQSDALIESEPELPRGISAQLWNRRNILFNQTLTPDDRVFRLIQEGFDPEEVFRLYELIENGEVTEQTTIGAPSHRIKANLILINGTVANIQLDRETLSRTFIRPPNAFYIFFSTIVTFIMTFFVSNLRYFTSTTASLYLMFIPATAVFSLLLPPSCDPYSTTLNDPAIGFTRAVALFIITASISLLDYFDEKNFFDISHRSIIEIEIILANCCVLLPFLIFIGFIGHPITSIHYLLEVINKYLFGIAGSSSLYRSLVSFASYFFHFTLSSLLLKFKNSYGTNLLMIIYFSFVVQFCFEDFSKNRFFNVLLFRLLRTVISTISALSSYFIHIKELKIVPIMITIIHFFIDIVFPYISTHQSYLFLHGRLIQPHKSISLITNYSRCVFVPFFLSYLILNYPIHCTLTSLIIIQSLNISQSVPHIYSIALLLATFTLHFEFSIKSLSLSVLISFALARKLIKVSNVLRMFNKRFYFPPAIYSDPYTNLFEFVRILIISIFIIIQPHLSLSFSFLSIVWSCITGAPPMIFFGLGAFLEPSAPRPNCFYDDASISFEHENFFNIKTDSPIEVPVYVSLSKALESTLFSIIKNSRLGIVNDDSFFLLVDNDLVAILHIIAIEPTCVRFQIRGLEYEQQTLCHNGELSVIQQIILEQKDFGNLGHAIAFHFSMFEIVEKSLDLDMISVSQYNYKEIVFAVLGSETTFDWFYRACAYIAVRDQSEFIDENANESTNIGVDAKVDTDDTISINIDDETNNIDENNENSTNNNNDTQTNEIINNDDNTNNIENTNDNDNNTITNDNNNNDNDTNGNINNINENIEVDFKLSEEENVFIDKVFRYFQKQPNERTVSLIKKSFKYILGKIKSENGINDSGLLTFFNGSFDGNEIEGCDEKMRKLIINSVRYGVLLSLNSSVDLAPSIDDFDDFFSFMKESEEQPILPVSDDNFLETIANIETALITLVSISNDVYIARFSRSTTSWAVFKMETESVRGFWANEARNILFDAIVSNERPSIQFDLHFLRNITNQSCNQPVGYPVLVSNINASLE